MKKHMKRVHKDKDSWLLTSAVKAADNDTHQLRLDCVIPLSIWAFYEESHEEKAQGQGQEKGRAQLTGLDWKATDNDTQLSFPLRRAAFPGKQADTQGRWSPFSKNLSHLSRKFSTALLHCKRSFELFFQGYFFYFFSFSSTGVRFLNSPPWRACKSSWLRFVWKSLECHTDLTLISPPCQHCFSGPVLDLNQLEILFPFF